jgi:hypothetical protein
MMWLMCCSRTCWTILAKWCRSTTMPQSEDDSLYSVPAGSVPAQTVSKYHPVCYLLINVEIIVWYYKMLTRLESRKVFPSMSSQGNIFPKLMISSLVLLQLFTIYSQLCLIQPLIKRTKALGHILLPEADLKSSANIQSPPGYPARYIAISWMS